MNKLTIVAMSCLVGGGLLGWTGTKLFGAGHEEHAAEHGNEKNAAAEKGHDEHKDEAHGDEKHEGEAKEKHEESEHAKEGEAGHGDEHGEEGAEPGTIPDSMLVPAGIAIDSVRPSTLAQVIVLPGRITNDPTRTFTATARFPGVLRSFGLKAGSKVKVGDLVARIESDATLEPYEIRAPRAGTVLHTEATEGQVVASGQILAEIADLGSVLAELKVGSGNFGKLRVGQPVTVTMHGDEIGKRTSVTALLPQVDPATQMRTVQAKLDNSRGVYGDGLFVQGLVETGRFAAALTVPLASVQTSKGKTVVYVREGERFEERQVTTGKKDGERIEVLSGLKRGERVAAIGSFVVKADLGKSEAEHAH
ncbi:MAG TPA: efflux RND transporter periplasmic adaptor subunit [Fibrobacteria bacterium]|nr:efflux RND transporter periplasmic adaptor subunit [Fibrobacteria bacterium]